MLFRSVSDGVCGLVPGALLIVSYLTFMAFIQALLWAGLLDELSSQQSLASPAMACLEVQPGVLLGLILETEVDKFGRRTQQHESSSSGQVQVCRCCVGLAPPQCLLNSVEPLLSAQREVAWAPDPSWQEDW